MCRRSWWGGRAPPGGRRAYPREVAGFEDIIGESRAIRLAADSARGAAVRDVPVLLLGERHGKEMFAQAIHKASRRKADPFALNCAALPRELLESVSCLVTRRARSPAQMLTARAPLRRPTGDVVPRRGRECDPARAGEALARSQPPANAAPCHRVFSQSAKPERGQPTCASSPGPTATFARW